ncbi:MAG: AAA family ATPase [Bacteroidota bacterium]
MQELIKALGEYDDISHERLFVVLYDSIPSTLALKVPMKCTQEKVSQVLESLTSKLYGFRLVAKHWRTQNHSDTDGSEDYVNKCLYKGEDGIAALVELSFNFGTFFVEIFYDCTNSALEERLLALNAQLRKAYGTPTSPKLRVLTKSEHVGFTTQGISTDRTELSIKDNYNEAFLEVDKVIKETILQKRSGLILLHGSPGTGKTTYIRSLVSEFEQLKFIFIQNEFVAHLMHPDFISFLLNQRDAILIIEDAEKVIISREGGQERSVVSTILQLTDGLFSDYLNIKIICTFNTHLSKIDTALLRKGRLIAMHEFKPLALDKTNALLESMGLEKTKEGMSVADIYNYGEKAHANIKKKNNIGF